MGRAEWGANRDRLLDPLRRVEGIEVPGLSENIRVISIVDRYLEHVTKVQ